MIFDNYRLNRLLPVDKTKFTSYEEYEEKAKFVFRSYGVKEPSGEMLELFKKAYKLSDEDYEIFVRKMNLDYLTIRDNIGTVNMIFDKNKRRKNKDKLFEALSQMNDIYKDRNSITARIITSLFAECKSADELAVAVSLLSEGSEQESVFAVRCQEAFMGRLKNYEVIDYLKDYVEELSSINSIKKSLLKSAKVRFNDRMLTLKKIEDSGAIAAANKTITVALKEAKRRA